MMIMQSCFYIVQNREFCKQADILKSACNAHFADFMRLPAHNILPIQADSAVGGTIYAGEHIEHRGLSGAVGAEESEDFAPRHIERNAVYGGKIAEPLAQFPDGYDRFTHGASVL